MQTVESTPDQALRPREAAKMLGVSVRTLANYTRQGRLPRRKGPGKNGAVLYSRKALQAFLIGDLVR